MPLSSRLRPWWLLATMLLASATFAQPTAGPSTAAALRERHAQLATQLQNTPFLRPMVLQSSEDGDVLQGSIDAVVSQPFALAREQLQQPAALCEIMMLQLNTKQCTVAGSVLDARIGRKHDQPLKDAYRVAFNLQVQAASAEYLSLRLAADTGPFSTRDYRIQLQAIPLAGGNQTFLHLRYSYGIGMAARLAMQGYLATLGAGKVGFTRSGSGYIGGMRGAVERNTMRYYLAIDAYLASLAAPPAQQRAKRLDAWFDATEQYARQLHEVERVDYLAMKQSEFKRMGVAG
ncbi:MAG TPA: hypothetical protein VFL64_18240 [Rhizobacter sp.]|nr:hypothetical protein [Rhizobacter sp.]